MEERSRLRGRAAWERRDVREDAQERGMCARSAGQGAERGREVLEEVGAKQRNSRLFWQESKQTDAFLTPKPSALGLDGEGKGDI